MAQQDSKPITLDRSHMRALREIVHATDQTPWRPVLGSVHVAVEQVADVEPPAYRLVLTATDSYLIVRRHIAPEITPEWAGRTFLLNAAELERAMLVMLRDKTEQSITLTEVEDGILVGWSCGTWKVHTVEGKFPDCNGFATGFKSGTVDQIALNPRMLERMARALGVWPFKHSEGFRFEFHADDKPVRVTDYRATGADFGLIMPARRNPQ